MMNDQEKREMSFGALMIVPAAIIGLLGWLRASGDTVDDAYISFRCVQNFIDGHGLTFNPGVPVEAFSNPLFVILLIPFAALGMSMEIVSQFIGILSFAVCIYTAGSLSMRSGLPREIVYAAIACVVGFFPFLYYSVTGLETGLFAAVIMLGIYFWQRRGGLGPAGAAAWFAVAISRPEGPGYLVALLPAVLLLEGEGRKKSLAWWVAVVAAVACFTLLRKWYYGLWLPNTFYAKPPGTADLDPRTSHVWASAVYLYNFLLETGIALPLAAVCYAMMLLRRGVARFRNGFLLPLLGTIAVGTAFAAYTGGDWFPASRYLIPIVTPLFLMGCIGIAEMTNGRPHLQRLLAVICVVSVLIGSSLLLWQFHSGKNRYPYHVMNSTKLAEAGLWLRDNLPEDARIVTYRIGAVGYHSQRHIIDLFGLPDHHVARLVAAKADFHPWNNYGDSYPELSAYVAEQDPDAVLIIHRNPVVPPPASISVYGFEFSYTRVFPLGADQEWILYLRTGG